MNLNYTRVLHFLTVVKYMNMNKAAKELFISQPALSLSISRLEKELGLSLFYRDKNKLILSKEAEILLPRFEEFRQAHDILVSDASGLMRPHDNHINISFSGSAFFFPVFYMSNFLSSYDGDLIHICYVDVEQATSMLLTNQTDFALSYYPVTHPLLSTMTVMSEPIGLIVSQSHPLASQAVVSLKDLETVKLHGLNRHHGFRSLCDQICQSVDIHLDYETEDDYPAYYKRISDTNDGCGFLSTKDNFDLNFKPQEHYVFLNIDCTAMERSVGISYLSSGKKQYKYQGLLNYIKENFASQSFMANKLSLAINREFWGEVNR